MDRDRLEITTPEGVSLALDLAGVGSRGLAIMVDFVIQGAILFALSLMLQDSGAAGDVIFWPILFLLLLGYHIAFETWGGGQTPGKRALKLRVVHSDGGPIGFVPSTIRTFLRIIDFLPWFYLVGIVAVFSTNRNQRLGDLAAGTVVVQERDVRSGVRAGTTYSSLPQTPEAVVGWDASQVTAQELAVVKRFFARRHQMDPMSRQRLASDLARRLEAKVSRPDEIMSAEQFLMYVITAKEGREG